MQKRYKKQKAINLNIPKMNMQKPNECKTNATNEIVRNAETMQKLN